MDSSLPRLARLLAYLGLVATVTAGPALAQAENEAYFAETIEVAITNLDLVVRDKDGAPVTDLTAEDFRITENGKEVEIRHFAYLGAVDANTTSADAGTAGYVGGAPVTLALAIDNFSLHAAGRDLALKQAREFLSASLNAGDRVVVMSLDPELAVHSPPTDSIAALSAALDAIAEDKPRGEVTTASYRDTIRTIAQDLNNPLEEDDANPEIALAAARAIRIYAQEAYSNTLRTLATLREAVESLSLVDGPKALVYVGAGITEQPAAGLIQYWNQRFAGLAGLDSRIFEQLREVQEYDASDAVRDLTAYANQQRLALYTVAPEQSEQGLTGVERSMRDGQGRAVLSPQMLSAESVHRAQAMSALADATGGRFNNGDLDDLLRDLAADFRHLYSLAYTPPADAGKDGVRVVEVEVLRPGVKVSFGRRYREISRQEHLVGLTRSALMVEAESNPLGAAMRLGEPAYVDGDRVRVPVQVRIPLASVALVPKGKVHEGRLALFVGARDDKGRFTQILQHAVPIQISAQALDQALQQAGGYSLDLELRRRDHTVAMTLHDVYGQTESVLRTQLVVD